uniref:PFB0640c protein n=1 Tax=Plasmodium falciparum TaxID=5833 RepID=Q689C9_PLAFA|nr:PFB0640c [Plasmodium falciparum 3D7]
MLAKRLQNEKFDIRAASICYLCACNFSETVEIWNNMPSKKTSLLNVLQDIVEKMTILKMIIKYENFNSIMNQKISQYAELLANSGRLKAAMTFLCLIQHDQSIESLILRDRIYNSANHVLCQQIKPPISPFQIVDIKPSPNVYQNNMYNNNNNNNNININSSSNNNNNNNNNKVLSSMHHPMQQFNQCNVNKMYTSTSNIINNNTMNSNFKSVIPPPLPMNTQMNNSTSSIQPPPSVPPTKFHTQIINNTMNSRSSIATTTKNYPTSNLNSVIPTSMNNMNTNISHGNNVTPPYMSQTNVAVPNMNNNNNNNNTMNPTYPSLPKFPNYNLNSQVQQNSIIPEKQLTSPMFSSNSYGNINKTHTTNNAVPPPPNVTSSVVTPPMPSNQLNNTRSSFADIQNVVSPPRNKNQSISSTANLNYQHDNQFNKRECMEQPVYPMTNQSSMFSMNNTMQKKNLPGGFQDNTSQMNYGMQPTGSPPPSSIKLISIYVYILKKKYIYIYIYIHVYIYV